MDVYQGLAELQKESEKIFGHHFFQIAFYCDNREQNNIGKIWIKVETDFNGEYKAWQIRDVSSFEEAYREIIKKIK